MQPYLLQFLLMTIAGWINRKQQDAIEYLKEENRVLRQQLGGRRIRFSNDQRRRLAAKAKALGREVPLVIDHCSSKCSRSFSRNPPMVNAGR